MSTPNPVLLLERLATCSTQAAGIDGDAHCTKGVMFVCGEAECRVIAATGAQRRGNVSAKELRNNFHLPLHIVAKKFGMCPMAFKKLCR